MNACAPPAQHPPTHPGGTERDRTRTQRPGDPAGGAITRCPQAAGPAHRPEPGGPGRRRDDGAEHSAAATVFLNISTDGVDAPAEKFLGVQKARANARLLAIKKELKGATLERFDEPEPEPEPAKPAPAPAKGSGRPRQGQDDHPGPGKGKTATTCPGQGQGRPPPPRRPPRCAPATRSRSSRSWGATPP